MTAPRNHTVGLGRMLFTSSRHDLLHAIGGSLLSSALALWAGVATQAASNQAASRLPMIRPKVEGVFPHGGKRGTDVDVTIRGRNLQDASDILFATPKITGRILSVTHTCVYARFHVDLSAEPGRHDFRIAAPQGSTVGWFDVGTRPEISEKEPNDDREHAQPIQVPVLINGTIRAGDYDYFTFTARAGQTFTFDVNATRNGSQLDSVLSLLDEDGSEVDYSDDYYALKDPHLVHTFATTGTYYVRIYGSGEDGSENDDYRFMVGEMPQVDFAMPPGGQRGSELFLQLKGVNLNSIKDVVLGDGLARGEIADQGPQSATVRMKIPSDLATGVYQLHVSDAIAPVPFVVSDHAEITVKGNEALHKQDPLPIQLPVVANGVLDRHGAGDYFIFSVDRPKTVVLMVDSMQLGFPLDPMVAIYDETGKRLAWQDEPTTNTFQVQANLDPHLVVHLPAAGRYVAMVRDSEYRGARDFLYRFTIKEAEPDFSVKVKGSDETLFRGKANAIPLRVRRLEGWDAPIEVWAENLPNGVTSRPVVAKAENTKYKGGCAEEHFFDGTDIEVPLIVSETAPAGFSQIRFRARGVMNGRVVEHEARTQYWWTSRQKLRGDSETTSLYATIADPPLLVLTTPDKLSIAPSKSGKLKVLIARFDDGNTPLWLGVAIPSKGVVVEPATVPAGAAVAELNVSNTSRTPVDIWLVGKSEGTVLGKSNPILIEPTANKDEVTDDEN